MAHSNTTALHTVLNYIADSRDGYKKAAETVDHYALKRVFNARAIERAAMAARIEDTLRERGLKTDNSGTALGTFHRNMMSALSLVQSDNKAAIQTLDDGEERLRDRVRDAIENSDLPTRDRAMLSSIERELEADASILENFEETVG